MYLFNLLSGYSTNEEYDKLLVAPHSVRSGIIKRIKKEINNNKLGKPSGIRIKCNSLVDEQTIDALYDASNNGVTVELVIRGMCALKPGVQGLSENIIVRSILGRFLEHSRIYEFVNFYNSEEFGLILFCLVLFRKNSFLILNKKLLIAFIYI
jgi:polyphosphate kinase